MKIGMLEHINLTVSDPDRTARRLCALFGWRVRWQGPSINKGYTVHVGAGNQYIALYTHEGTGVPRQTSYDTKGGLNHIGIVVDDLDATEEHVLASGYETYSHGDYEPGRRFYYRDEDGIEIEVVSYARVSA